MNFQQIFFFFEQNFKQSRHMFWQNEENIGLF